MINTGKIKISGRNPLGGAAAQFYKGLTGRYKSTLCNL
ncbi:MAG: hypothetical protein OFPI_14930 [Osedax symbiont Rs2]|nr:MAG: hypothetical protein OFPI_14930 [Osedax symbiont Rs2]